MVTPGHDSPIGRAEPAVPSTPRLTLLGVLLIMAVLSASFALFWATAGLAVVLAMLAAPMAWHGIQSAMRSRLCGVRMDRDCWVTVLLSSLTLASIAMAAAFAAFCVVGIPVSKVAKPLEYPRITDRVVIPLALGGMAGILAYGFVLKRWWFVPDMLVQKVQAQPSDDVDEVAKYWQPQEAIRVNEP